MVARLADEQGGSANLALWALGVGRGVDAAELVRIIDATAGGGSSKGSAPACAVAAKTATASGALAAVPGPLWYGLPGKERYLDLCVRDDAPW